MTVLSDFSQTPHMSFEDIENLRASCKTLREGFDNDLQKWVRLVLSNTTDEHEMSIHERLCVEAASQGLVSTLSALRDRRRDERRSVARCGVFWSLRRDKVGRGERLFVGPVRMHQSSRERRPPGSDEVAQTHRFNGNPTLDVIISLGRGRLRECSQERQFGPDEVAQRQRMSLGRGRLCECSWEWQFGLSYKNVRRVIFCNGTFAKRAQKKLERPRKNHNFSALFFS